VRLSKLLLLLLLLLMHAEDDWIRIRMTPGLVSPESRISTRLHCYLGLPETVLYCTFMNEGKSNSEPLNTCTGTTIVLSLEKECRSRIVRFPFIDWDEETQRTARGFAQRKARKAWGKKMTPEDRTRLITRTFQWLQLENNQPTIMAFYSKDKVFKFNLDYLLLERREKKSAGYILSLRACKIH
jgi:hypothetical protein